MLAEAQRARLYTMLQHMSLQVWCGRVPQRADRLCEGAARDCENACQRQGGALIHLQCIFVFIYRFDIELYRKLEIADSAIQLATCIRPHNPKPESPTK